jgi:hypothetical protein
MSLKFIDLFAGIGGMRIAFEDAGAECVLTCEINEDALKTYINSGDSPRLITGAPLLPNKDSNGLDVVKVFSGESSGNFFPGNYRNPFSTEQPTYSIPTYQNIPVEGNDGVIIEAEIPFEGLAVLEAGIPLGQPTDVFLRTTSNDQDQFLSLILYFQTLSTSPQIQVKTKPTP